MSGQMWIQPITEHGSGRRGDPHYAEPCRLSEQDEMDEILRTYLLVQFNIVFISDIDVRSQNELYHLNLKGILNHVTYFSV